MEPDSRGILIKMEPIFDVKQIRLSDLVRPLRMSFCQSFSEIRDNWEQKRRGRRRWGRNAYLNDHLNRAQMGQFAAKKLNV